MGSVGDGGLLRSGDIVGGKGELSMGMSPPAEIAVESTLLKGMCLRCASELIGEAVECLLLGCLLEPNHTFIF